MNRLFVFLVIALVNVSYAETTKEWFKNNADEFTALFAEASKIDGNRGLTQSELEQAIGKPDFEEINNLIVTDKKAWTLKNGKSESETTQEFVWKLSDNRRLQVIIANSSVIYAFIVNNKQKELVWK